MRVRAAAIIAAAMLAILADCAHSTSSSGMGGACDNTNFLAVQHAHDNGAEVTLCGMIERVRPIRTTRSGAHRVFFVDVGHRNTIEIDANVGIIGDLPVHQLQKAIVRGEYYYDGGGREGVHFTHHAYAGRHESGYIIVGGHRYE